MSALSLQDISVTVDSTEPRIQDLKLAEALNFERPRDIRKLVSRYQNALKTLGELVCATVAQTPKGGRPSKEYWLNEKQALFLCTKSEAEHALDATIEMVEVFYAVKSGQTVQVRPHARRLPKPEPKFDERLIHYCSSNWSRLAPGLHPFFEKEMRAIKAFLYAELGKAKTLSGNERLEIIADLEIVDWGQRKELLKRKWS